MSMRYKGERKILLIRMNHSYAGFFSYVTFALNQLRYCEAAGFHPVVYFGPRSGDGPNAPVAASGPSQTCATETCSRNASTCFRRTMLRNG